MAHPLIFIPFNELKETFCREEMAHGFFFQKSISITQENPAKIEIKIMNESSIGSSGTAVSLDPKQVIVLRDLLAAVTIVENEHYRSDSLKESGE